MKHLSTRIDDETERQIRELAELWGLPEVRHNSQVIARCIERVWMVEFGHEQYRDTDNQNNRSIDNVQ